MSDLNPDDEQAVDRLAFFIMKEVYAASASVMMSMDGEVANALFSAVDRRVTDSLQRMAAGQTEGPSSNAIALSVGAKLAAALEHAHGREPFRGKEEPGLPSAAGPAERSGRVIRREEALQAIAAFRAFAPKT